MDANFRNGEQATADERAHEAWLEEAEAKTGLDLSMNDDALIAYFDGLTPQQFSDSLWIAQSEAL